MSKEELVKIVNQQIKNMWGVGGYFPKRMKPKWESTIGADNKFDLYVYYVTQKRPSIGFQRLTESGHPEHTLEALIFENPKVEKLLPKGTKDNCIKKFSKYPNGKKFLLNHNVLLSSFND